MNGKPKSREDFSKEDCVRGAPSHGNRMFSVKDVCDVVPFPATAPVAAQPRPRAPIAAPPREDRVLDPCNFNAPDDDEGDLLEGLSLKGYGRNLRKCFEAQEQADEAEALSPRDDQQN